jgi:hypothetical protein
MNPLQKQIAIYVALGVVALLVLYYVSSQFKNAVTGFFTGEGTHQAVNPDEAPISTNPANRSYPIEQYGIWADSIYEALNYTGSNWTAVYDVIEQMKTDDDVKALMNAYGVRPLYIFGIPSAPLNLSQAFTRESSMWNGTSDVNEILSNNGISFRF